MIWILPERADPELYLYPIITNSLILCKKNKHFNALVGLESFLEPLGPMDSDSGTDSDEEEDDDTSENYNN